MCCPYRKGGYGCCPYNSSSSSCCSMDYCCQEFNCDTDSGGCTNIAPTGWPVTWPGTILQPPVNRITTLTTSISSKCPDQVTACPTNNTCCLKSDGSYDCCSSLNGVCCADSTHCCPEHYVCFNGYYDHNCYDPRTKYDHIGYSPRFNATKLGNIKTCPNGVDICDVHHTCCPSAEKGVGCCKLPNAVCCPTKGYCCPFGTTCDEKDELCLLK